jgi:hypothetical protein
MDPEGSHHVCNNLPLVHILQQMHQVHTYAAHFPKIHSNILYQSTHSLLSGLIPSGFQTNAFHPSHPP